MFIFQKAKASGSELREAKSFMGQSVCRVTVKIGVAKANVKTEQQVSSSLHPVSSPFEPRHQGSG